MEHTSFTHTGNLRSNLHSQTQGEHAHSRKFLALNWNHGPSPEVTVPSTTAPWHTNLTLKSEVWDQLSFLPLGPLGQLGSTTLLPFCPLLSSPDTDCISNVHLRKPADWVTLWFLTTCKAAASSHDRSISDYRALSDSIWIRHSASLKMFTKILWLPAVSEF